MLPLMLLLGCSQSSVVLSDFELDFDKQTGGLTVLRLGEPVLEVLELAVGRGEADISFSVGSYLFENETETWRAASSMRVQSRIDDTLLLAELRDDAGDPLASLEAFTVGADLLALHMTPYQTTGVDGQAVNRVRALMDCSSGGPFLGTGGHQLDVDHQGEAFHLWVSEPGVGKVEDDDPPDDWFVTGTRHATSYPLPFVLRPEVPVGVLLDTLGRVDVDLCSSDPSVFELAAWDDSLRLFVVGGDDALEVVETQALAAGGVSVPPDVAFGPWNDAVHGVDEVLLLATALRDAGAPTGLMWTEDWKGGEDNGLGYRLSLDWYLDEDLYPEPDQISAELDALGFQWLAYFSPFVGEDTVAWDETQDLLIQTSEGEPYTWISAALTPTSALDLTRVDAHEWAQARMTDVLDAGFVGWMADFGEWLPPDAELAYADALDNHNGYPLWWQQTNRDLLQELGGTWFSRSGWTGTPAISPITWGGDQRTSFDTDDGFPTVLPLGIGLGIGGVAFYAHDIAGYNSVGNDPATKELWFRWAWLGAFSPIMRTHHGAYGDENHDLLSDEASMAHWVRTATEHARLFPYLRGLADVAQSTGRPLVLHPGLVYPGYDWGRIDAWLLGQALFVAPVLEEGATGRDVTLPPGDWYDWWTGASASTGWVDAAMDEIPVFAAGGTVVPMLASAPQTFVPHASLTDLDDVDDARVLRVFGTGGSFTEADGTTYSVSGTGSSAETATETLTSGSIVAGGLTISISGDVARTYTVEAYP